jgi:hypothetical protein
MRGARNITGDNPKVVCAEFSTLSQAVLVGAECEVHTKHPTSSRVENQAQVLYFKSSLSMSDAFLEAKERPGVQKCNAE